MDAFDGDLSFPEKPARNKAPHTAVPKEGLSFNEVEQVPFDVRAHDAVGFDHLAGLGIDIVPRTTDLRLEPPFQWAEQVAKPFLMGVRTADAFAFRKVIKRLFRTRELAGIALAAARSLDDDFVHVWSHGVVR